MILANVETAMSDLCPGNGFQDGWCHPLPKIDRWHATRATRSNGGPEIISEVVENGTQFRFEIG